MATKKKVTGAQSPENNENTETTSTGYEEWRGEIIIERDGKTEVNRRFEKLKKMRSNVKITDDEAAVLNEAALSSPRTDHVIYYLKPE
jgi:hypothetical protein